MAGFVNFHNMEKFLLPSSRELWKLSKLSFRVLRCYAIHTLYYTAELTQNLITSWRKKCKLKLTFLNFSKISICHKICRWYPFPYLKIVIQICHVWQFYELSNRLDLIMNIIIHPTKLADLPLHIPFVLTNFFVSQTYYLHIPYDNQGL